MNKNNQSEANTKSDEGESVPSYRILNKMKTNIEKKTLEVGQSDYNKINNIIQIHDRHTNPKKENFPPSPIHKTNPLNSHRLPDYTKYNIQDLVYKLEHDYSHTKIEKEESFMTRMMFDVFKRHSKEQRVSNLVQKNKPKINEFDRVNTFNRLIDDANRRLVAWEKMDSMKDNLNNYTIKEKGVDSKQWEKTYNERFIKYKKEKENILEKKIIQREKLIKEKEDAVLSQVNKSTKKVKKNVLENIVNRMYSEAEKREIKKEQKAKEIEQITNKLEAAHIDTYRNNLKAESKIKQFINNVSTKSKNLKTNYKSENTIRIRSRQNNLFAGENTQGFYITESENEEDRKEIPVPTESSLLKINELKGPNFKNGKNNKFKRMKGTVPDYLTANIVDDILKRKI